MGAASVIDIKFRIKIVVAIPPAVALTLFQKLQLQCGLIRKIN